MGQLRFLRCIKTCHFHFSPFPYKMWITSNLASPFVGVPAALCRMICGDWL